MKKLMKSFVAASFAALILGAVLTGCNKEDNEDYLGTIAVQLELKEGLSNIPLANVNISLISVQDNVERKQLTNATGFAEFISLPAGNYNLNISEPREEDDYVLSASVANIVVVMKETTPVKVEVDAVSSNANLVIKEVYYSGANDGYVSMYKDQFIEIFNNSSEVIYADGLHVANLFPNRWTRELPEPINKTYNVNEFVYADWVYKIPGSGTQYPIQPGKGFVIALNALNFKEGNPKAEMALDLTGSDLETYAIPWLESQGRTGNPNFDYDNPDVVNVTPVYARPVNMFYFMLETYGPAIVIFRTENEFTQADVQHYQFNSAHNGALRDEYMLKIPSDLIIDGINIERRSDLGDWYRLPKSVDSSFIYIDPDGNPFYLSKSVRRKIDQTASNRFGRVVLQTTRSSFNDFEVTDFPSPKGYNNITF